MTKKKIVVIGGGVAGVHATRELSKKLKADADITLIDKHSYHTSMTQLHEVAAGRVPFTTVQYDFQKLLGKRKNVSLVTDAVVTLDKDNKKVITEQGSYDYDYVVVALGGEPNDFGVPGVKEHGFTLWSLEDAMRIKRQLETVVQYGSTEVDDEKRRALLTISVAGSGFTGIEMAGELIDWRKKVSTDWKIPEEEITINVVEMMPTILNTLDRKQADRAHAYLEKKNVNVLTNHGIVEVAEDHIKVNVGGRDEEKVSKEIPTHTLIWTTGVQGNTAAQTNLNETERGHRLQANEFMEAVGFEDKGIYVAGDVSGYIEPDTGRPTPQIVEAAEQTAHTAASNIIADINGGSKHKHESKYQGTMVSIGSTWGVAKVGSMRLTGFWAMLMKNIVYFIYTLQIRSAHYFWRYALDEVFRTKDDRNFMRGHTSRLGNVLWAVPLRIFYGLVWLTEAMKKIVGEGQLFNPTTWFGKGSWFTDDLKFPFAWLQEVPKHADAAAGATGEAATKAADAAAGATGAAASGGAEAAHKATEWGLSYAYGTEPMPVLEKVPHWMEPIFKFMIPNRDVALFMQKFMSIVEVLLALAIIFGLFTWIASAVTAALTVMFALSGMFFWVNIWFIPVAIALMNGSGRAFGLDKWVQPWIQKILTQVWYGKSRSIYKGR
ncbi:FAD-dependent oxidoreductase [Lactococcus petauri]|uniref:FAD-dependent oxidoreductase n=1 Tax=Lactococcus petauri TaxID=1940789 RepID=UPI00254E70BC|nr:FAD-dependent oxidoreductase [Lactococcus petauri]